MSYSLQHHGLCLSGSSVCGISQARILQWGAISFSNNLLWNRNHDIFTLMPLPSFYPQWSTVPGIQSSLNKDHGTGLSARLHTPFAKDPSCILMGTGMF